MLRRSIATALLACALFLHALPAGAQSPTTLRAGARSLSEFFSRTGASSRTTSLAHVSRDLDDDASLLLLYLQKEDPQALALLADFPELVAPLQDFGLRLPVALPTVVEDAPALTRMCGTGGDHFTKVAEALGYASLVGVRPAVCEQCPAAVQTVYTDVLRALHEGGVDYVLTGGVAINAHGVQRVTHDLDIAVAVTEDNLARLMNALEPFGFAPRLPVPLEQLGNLDIVRGWIRDKNLAAFTLLVPNGNHAAEIDIMLNPTLSYERIRAGSVRIDADIPVNVADLPTIIAMKQAAGRPKDLLDIPLLQNALRAEQPRGSAPPPQ